MTTDPVQTVLDRLDDVKVQSDGQWTAKCPAHDDRKPSLSIGVGDDGRALVNCKAGCSIDDVLAAMSPPMSKADLFVSSNGSATKRTSQRKIVATYDYVDSLGVLLFQVVRYSDKSFLQRRPSDDGHWIWGLTTGEYVHRPNGDWSKPKTGETGGERRSFPKQERVPYRSPELNRAPDHAMVYLTEGEKDADRLIAEGMIATTTSGGAGKWKHTDDTPLHKRHIAFIPDNDTPGHEHVQGFAAHLHGKAKSIRIIELSGLPEHGDVSDWLDAGNDVADLDELAAQAPEWEPEDTSLACTPEAETAIATIEPYRNRQESMRAINEMATTSRQLREMSITLAEQVARWFDRRGPETLDGIDYPVSYAAAAIGVSRCYFHRLGQVGRVRRLLPAGNTAVVLSDRAIRPLTRLLLDRPEAIPQAVEAANELVKAEAIEQERTKPKPVSYKHTTAVVDEIIGPVEKADAKHSVIGHERTDADFIAIQQIRHQIADLADAAAAVSNVPPDLLAVIRTLAKHPWSCM